MFAWYLYTYVLARVCVIFNLKLKKKSTYTAKNIYAVLLRIFFPEQIRVREKLYIYSTQNKQPLNRQTDNSQYMHIYLYFVLKALKYLWEKWLKRLRSSLEANNTISHRICAAAFCKYVRKEQSVARIYLKSVFNWI